MSISPWRSSATLPVWNVTLVDPLDPPGSGTQPSNISGGTLTLIIRNATTGVDIIGGGAFTVVNGPAGTATYAPVAADSAQVSTFQLLAKGVFSGGGVKYWDLGVWTVLPG